MTKEALPILYDYFVFLVPLIKTISKMIMIKNP